MEVNDAKRLQALEEENRRLKAMVADLALDNQLLQAINERMVRLAARCEAVDLLRRQFDVSERRAVPWASKGRRSATSRSSSSRLVLTTGSVEAEPRDFGRVG